MCTVYAGHAPLDLSRRASTRSTMAASSSSSPLATAITRSNTSSWSTRGGPPLSTRPCPRRTGLVVRSFGVLRDADLSDFCRGRSDDSAVLFAALRIAPYSSESAARFSFQDGVYSVDLAEVPTSSPYKWYGYWVAVPSCDYTVEFDARLLPAEAPGLNSGRGYAAGVCASLRGSQPQA